MKKTSKELLAKHDSYIDALKDAISRWESADTEHDCVDYMVAVGEIGAEIHRMNKTLGLR